MASARCSLASCPEMGVVRLTSEAHRAASRAHGVEGSPLWFCLVHAQEYRLLGYSDAQMKAS